MTQKHYNICCEDQETCIEINVDRYHVGHQLEKYNNKDHHAMHDASAPHGELMPPTPYFAMTYYVAAWKQHRI